MFYNYQEIIFYAAPSQQAKYESLNEVDPELLATFNKLGISLDEQKKLAGVAGIAVECRADGSLVARRR